MRGSSVVDLRIQSSMKERRTRDISDSIRTFLCPDALNWCAPEMQAAAVMVPQSADSLAGESISSVQECRTRDTSQMPRYEL